MRLPSDARTAIARAILAASTTLAFLSPWWWAPAPQLLLLTLLFGVLAAAAVSWRPDGRLVALGAGLGACVNLAPSPLYFLPMAVGAVHGAAVAEVARLATMLRVDRPLCSINDAAFAGGAIVVACSLPSALWLDSVAAVPVGIGVVMGGVALARHVRAAAWLRRAADRRACDAELRVSDSDQGLPTWSLLGPTPGPGQVLVVDPSASEAVSPDPAYRATWHAVAVVRPATRVGVSRALPWLYAVGAVIVAFVMLALSVPPCACGRTETARARARVDMQAIHGAALHYRAVNGDCPSPAGLVVAKAIDPASRLDDPWGRPYRIACVDDDVTVTSSGPDKKWDTVDDVHTQ